MRRRSASKVCCAGVLSGILLGGVALRQGRTQEGAVSPVFDTIQQQVQTLFERSRSAVVRVEAEDSHGQLAGTGFFVDPNGTLYTSWGVGGESRELVVCYGDMKYPARRLVADMRSGVAILKVDVKGPSPFVPVGSTRDLSVASPVMTIGYPMDLPPTPSFGMIGGFDIKYLGRYFGTRHIRANVAVQRGEGGAPLLNMKGEAVGVLISSLDQGSASFVLPIEAAEKVRRDYVRFGEVRPGWVGMVIGIAPVPVKGSVARVEEVLTGSPADKGGMKVGDVLTQIGARAVTCPEDMLDASFYLTAEDEIAVRVIREGAEIAMQVRPVEGPSRAEKMPFPALGTIQRPGAESLHLERSRTGDPETDR